MSTLDPIAVATANEIRLSSGVGLIAALYKLVHGKDNLESKKDVVLRLFRMLNATDFDDTFIDGVLFICSKDLTGIYDKFPKTKKLITLFSGMVQKIGLTDAPATAHLVDWLSGKIKQKSPPPPVSRTLDEEAKKFERAVEKVKGEFALELVELARFIGDHHLDESIIPGLSQKQKEIFKVLRDHVTIPTRDFYQALTVRLSSIEEVLD
nr:hypothetical protein [Candidatus Sigynarchaeota archaeon]